jgi:hypothetical protein
MQHLTDKIQSFLGVGELNAFCNEIFLEAITGRKE